MFSTAQFSYKNKVFCAYSSELRAHHRDRISIVNTRTQKIAVFEQSSIDWCATHEDIQGWWYKPSQDTINRIPKLRDVKVLIIND